MSMWMPSGLSQLPGVLARRESVASEQVAEQRSVGQLGRGDGEVSVGRVLGDSEIGVAGVLVDRLGADEYDGIEVRLQGFDRIKQRGAGPDVEPIRHARHPRCSASRKGARYPRTAPARAL